VNSEDRSLPALDKIYNFALTIVHNDRNLHNACLNNVANSCALWPILCYQDIVHIVVLRKEGMETGIRRHGHWDARCLRMEQFGLADKAESPSKGSSERTMQLAFDARIHLISLTVDC
jgi:hypothetical protein